MKAMNSCNTYPVDPQNICAAGEELSPSVLVTCVLFL